MIIEQLNGGRDRYALLSVSEIEPETKKGSFKHWLDVGLRIHSRDGFRAGEFYRNVVLGDETLAAMSDGLLSKIEDQIPLSMGWRNVDDVVGAVPNVPAFLAGHPQHMRRRQRSAKENAPLVIHMDLTSSMGISRSTVLARGVTLLALVRMLVNLRAVELWVGTTLPHNGNISATVAWRIDTAPLDLARASYHIADPAMSRLFGYSACKALHGKQLDGNWDRQRERVENLAKIAGWGDVLWIPHIHLNDPMVKDPVGWLKNTMKQYVNAEEDE